MLPVPLIDHVIINARDELDACAERFATLGFSLTPRGRHTLGSINHLAVLGTDYIELLGGPPGEAVRDLMTWPIGLNGLAFKTEDAACVQAALAAEEVGVGEAQSFSRPVLTPAGPRDASFRTTRLPRDSFPAGRLFFCEHQTPALVWPESRASHANGAIGISGMLVAAEDPAEAAELFGRMFGRACVRHTASGFQLLAGLATVELTTPAALVARLGSAAPQAAGRSAFMAALVLRTVSLERTWGEIPEARRFENGLVVPAHAACDTALLFRE